MNQAPSGDQTRVRLVLIAVAAALVLVLATITQVSASTERRSRLAWSLASVTITVALLVLLGLEVLRRLREERAVARADAALQGINGSPGDDSNVRRTPQLLQQFADALAIALGAAWACVTLDDSMNAVSFGGPAVPQPTPDGGSGPAAGLHLDSDLLFDGARIGSVHASAAMGKRFDRSERALLARMAPRMAAQLQHERLADAERLSRQEAEHARRQIMILARASSSLAPALENPAEAVADIGEVVVPDFADLFVVDIIGATGELERIVSRYGDPALEAAFIEQSGRYPDWSSTPCRIMGDGGSELVFRSPDERSSVRDDDHGALMCALDLQSWVVATIRVRGASVGTMTLATRDGRRGFRPSDQVTIDDLVARSAIAFERGLLYREARQSASDASRRADQLAQMVDATIVLTRTLAPSAVLQALVEQAASVLDAHHAAVQLDAGDGEGDGGLVAECGTSTVDAMRIAGPLVDRLGVPIGSLTVERGPEHPFGVDDEAVIRLLAESASIAHRNAVLYRDVQVREQRLQALVEASPLAIVEMDAWGTVQVANPAARTLFPVAPDDTAATVPLVRPPAELAEHLAGLLAILRSGAVHEARVDVELTTVDDAGTRHHLWVSTAPVKAADGSSRMLAVINDMSSHKHLEEELAKAQRFEAIATLAGGVAHDFNNLLTVILGYSELLLHGMDIDAADREPVQAIQEAGNHAAVITNQLLALSRHQVLPPETIDAVDRCRGLLPMLRRLVGADVVVEGRFHGSGHIKVDRGQLEQVLFNLVFNSRDAMPNGGHLTVEVDERVAPNGDEVVVVDVVDDGQGMDAETLARCQEPFFTTKGRSRGIGLGLATVAGIIERSGATLEMTSVPGEGTTCSVVFPRAVDAGRPEPAEGEPREAKVLLVDDDEGVRRFAARVLSGAGYCITEVADGESAIAKVDADGPFDMMVTDVVLPGMSGLDVVRVMHGRCPAMRCVVITGYNDTPPSAADFGAPTLIPKPFTAEELLLGAARSLDVPFPT